MTHTYLLSVATAILLVGCGGNTSTDASTDSTRNTSGTSSGTSTSGSTTTIQCRDIQPMLNTLNKKYASTRTAYADSKGSEENEGNEKSEDSEENEDSEGSGGSHNEGRDCLGCHSFASAGTVFNSLNAANNTPGAAGYRIKLSTGTVYGTARGTGNSRTSSFPSGNFTAQVMDPNGNVVNSSADMSHDGSRRACNSCHTASGNNGAPGRITSKRLSTGTQTSTPNTTVPAGTNCTDSSGGSGTVAVSFSSNVLPILTVKCKSCHGSNGRFTVTTANATYANISALKGSASAGGNYLLQKGSNSAGHGGGQVISTGSAEYTTIKAWVDSSAPNN